MQFTSDHTVQETSSCCSPVWLLFTALSLFVIQASASASGEFSLRLSTEHSNDGVAKLTWSVPQNQQIRLQQSHSEDFLSAKTLYQGRDTGTTITGLQDGVYYFRVGSSTQNDGTIIWDKPGKLLVEHHSMARAWAFFSVGVVVFLSTLILIILGSRRVEGSTT